jgi:uroporphyrinogen decarboxylase
MKEWTSRERVLAAIEHREPDRVPISFAGTAGTGILECPPEGKNYTKLCEYLSIENYEKPNISSVFNAVYNVDERIQERFGSDFRAIGPNPPGVRIEKDGTRTIMGILCGMRIKKMGYYDDVFEFPLRDATSKKNVREYPYWPTDEDFDKLVEGKREEAKNLRENTDYAIVYSGHFYFPFIMYPLLAGYDKWFIDMKLNPEFYFALCDKLLEIGLTIHEKMLEAIGDYIDIATTYDDMGNQRGLLCSRKDYLKSIKPYEKQMIEGIRKYTDAKIYRHSCGSVYDIIPDFIDLGIDILNPVQPLAKNMEPWRLKKEFGKYLTFCGGIDIQELLPHGTPEEVKEGVKNTIKTYAPGGGYILGPSHNIEPDTPVENIVAMYDAAQEYGKYPISS